MDQTTDNWYFQTDLDIRFLIPDKATHFLGSYGLSKIIGPAPAFVSGIVWEYYQYQTGGLFSRRDLLADALGVASAVLSPRGPPCLLVTWDKSERVIWLRLAVAF